MSQTFDLTQSTQPQLVNATTSVENSLSTTVVVAMCAVGIVLIPRVACASWLGIPTFEHLQLPNAMMVFAFWYSEMVAVNWVDGLGFLASTAVLATFCMRRMIMLRLLALASNILFAAYGYIDHLLPVLLLHLILFPVNILRLLELAPRKTFGTRFSSLSKLRLFLYVQEKVGQSKPVS